MTSNLLSVDPAHGRRSCVGVARFVDGTLVDAASLEVPNIRDIAERCAATALVVAEWCVPFPTEVVLEWQEILPGERNVAKLNQLFGLTGVCAAVAASFAGARVRSVLPRIWTQGTPKSKTKSGANPRHHRVRLRCGRPGESAIVDAVWGEHDALDAVGLGLWHLSRFETRRVFAGARKG